MSYDIEQFIRENRAYVIARYGSESAARAVWSEPGWYQRGGILPGGATTARNDSDHNERAI